MKDKNYEETGEEPWYKGPIKWVIGIFMILLIVLMAVPYYSIKLDPEPQENTNLEDINKLIHANPSKTANGIEEAWELIDKNNPQIKFAADSIISSSCDENEICYAKALYYFLRDKIKYVSDPIGKEYIEAPETVLKTGAADCESGSLLLLNMMESIGIESELVLIPGHAFIRIKIDKAPGKYKHEGWIYLDWTCESCGFGEVPYGSLGKKMRFMDI